MMTLARRWVSKRRLKQSPRRLVDRRKRFDLFRRYYPRFVPSGLTALCATALVALLLFTVWFFLPRPPLLDDVPFSSVARDLPKISKI
jgi:hypothetical protein